MVSGVEIQRGEMHTGTHPLARSPRFCNLTSQTPAKHLGPHNKNRQLANTMSQELFSALSVGEFIPLSPSA